MYKFSQPLKVGDTEFLYVKKNSISSRPRLFTQEDKPTELSHLNWHELRSAFEKYFAAEEALKNNGLYNKLLITIKPYLGTDLVKVCEEIQMPYLLNTNTKDLVETFKSGEPPRDLRVMKKLVDLITLIDKYIGLAEWFHSVSDYKELPTDKKVDYHKCLYYQTHERLHLWLASMYTEAFYSEVPYPVETEGWIDKTDACIGWLIANGIDVIGYSSSSSNCLAQLSLLLESGYVLEKHVRIKKRYSTSVDDTKDCLIFRHKWDEGVTY